VLLAIIAVDIEVLVRTVVEFRQLGSYLDHTTFNTCYKPQAEMRIAFQGFAIYSALACILLTTAIAFSCSERAVEFLARLIVNLSYIMFGPILLCFVNFGFTHFKGLAFVCSPRGVTHQVNFVDIVVLLTAFVISLCVTFTMAMQKTIDMASASFTDENSIIYRIISYYFSY
jgi:hypothetical protein